MQQQCLHYSGSLTKTSQNLSLNWSSVCLSMEKRVEAERDSAKYVYWYLSRGCQWWRTCQTWWEARQEWVKLIRIPASADWRNRKGDRERRGTERQETRERDGGSEGKRDTQREKDYRNLIGLQPIFLSCILFLVLCVRHSHNP